MSVWLVAAAAIALQPARPAAEIGSLVASYCPRSEARAYPLESRRQISSVVLQQVAIVNRGKDDVAISEVTIDLNQSGRAKDTRRLSGSDLAVMARLGTSPYPGEL